MYHNIIYNEATKIITISWKQWMFHMTTFSIYLAWMYLFINIKFK